jgi:hypothetical protein
MSSATANEPAFGDDLTFTRQVLRSMVGGTWVIGLVAGHRFQALIFEERADDPAWELGASRISKLWVQRLADRAVVFNWDRGIDVPAQDARAGGGAVPDGGVGGTGVRVKPKRPRRASRRVAPAA